MSHIVAFSLSSEGHLYPCVPILSELARRGHRVTLAFPSDVATPLEFAGLPLERVPWSTPPLSAGSRQNPRLAPFPSAPAFAQRGESLAVALETASARLRPDFLLVDPHLWGGLVAAEALSRSSAHGNGARWGVIAHNPLMYSGLGTDPRGPGLPPPRTFVARLRQRALQATIALETQAHVAVVNAVRERRGLPAIHGIQDMYRAPLTLATTTPPFEYPRSDWPQSLHFVGPVIWDLPLDGEIVVQRSDDRPIVLVSDSTVSHTGRGKNWTRAVLDALANEPYHVIATTASNADPAATRATGTGTHAFIPHSALLPHVACVVCHGGNGTVHKALWHGVPVVAVPFAFDRFEVARRLEVSGTGVMLPYSRLTPASIHSAVRRALRSRAQAQCMGRVFRASGGPRLAADLIERQLSDGRANEDDRRSCGGSGEWLAHTAVDFSSES